MWQSADRASTLRSNNTPARPTVIISDASTEKLIESLLDLNSLINNINLILYLIGLITPGVPQEFVIDNYTIKIADTSVTSSMLMDAYTALGKTQQLRRLI